MERYDLLVVGGGINGAGIAREAAGRGLSVALVEQDDLGAHTSSASSKLVHGGLRYLERCEFRLVAEALAEREVLARAAPHLVRPMRFVMPHAPGLRPAWMIRAGLFLYDYLARRATLPGSESVALRASPYGAGLKPQYERGFVYSDCRVDDARLVIATARSAAEHGAVILPRTQCLSARRANGEWRVRLRACGGMTAEVAARAIANATGPWARSFLTGTLGERASFGLRLVKGSHIMVPRLFEGEHAYILQNDDRRVVFVCPYEERYTLIGTTEVELDAPPRRCTASPEEVRYLCRAAGRYFAHPPSERDVVWSYCGVRPLFDDGRADPSAVTRDYVLRVDGGPRQAPVLSVFGGKITTYRRLAEQALERLARWFPGMRGPWTGTVPLPGGELDGMRFEDFAEVRLKRDFPWLAPELRRALAARHGALAYEVLAGAASAADLGEHYGAGLHAREVDYFVEREWARTSEDVLWRRTKAALHLAPEEREAVARRLARQLSG